MPVLNPVLLAKLEALLGERNDKENRAVRWSELDQFRKELIDNGGAGGPGGPNGGEPGGGGGTPTPTELDEIRAELAIARAQIDAAAQDSQNALTAAQNAQAGMNAAGAYTDDAIAALQASTSNSLALLRTDTEQYAISFLRGRSVLREEYFASAAWIRAGAAEGTVTRTAVAGQPVGSAFEYRVQVALDKIDGIVFDGASAAEWPGQIGANGYVIHLDFESVSGPVAGAAVVLNWINTIGQVFSRTIEIADLQAAGTNRDRAAIGVFLKPTNFTGTFSHHSIYLLANYASAPQKFGKTIKFKRISVRAATKEEMGKGLVEAAAAATFTNYAETGADPTGAFAKVKSEVTASFGDTIAKVTRADTVLANLNGTVARTSLLVDVNGGKAIAGLEIMAYDTDGQGTGAATKLHGDLFAPGTANVNTLVTGLGSNLLQDTRFWDGLIHWPGASGGGETTFALRKYPNFYAHPDYPTMMIYQNGTSAIYPYLHYAPLLDDGSRQNGAPVDGDKWHCFSVYVCALRCQVRIGMNFYDETGTLLTGPFGTWTDVAPGAPRNPGTWQRIHLIFKAPATAVTCKPIVQKGPTLAGFVDSYLFGFQPQLEPTHAAASLPTTYSSGEAGMMTGDRLYSRLIRGRHLAVNEIVVTQTSQLADAIMTSAKIAGVIQSDNFVSGQGGSGWRIQRSGSVELNDITIRRQIAVASGSVNVGTFRPRSEIPARTGMTGSGPVNDGGPRTVTLAYIEDVGVTLKNGPGNIVVADIPGLSFAEWFRNDRTYLVAVAMTGTLWRRFDVGIEWPADAASRWGWTGKLIPLQQTGGAPSLRIRLEFWCENIAQVDNCNVLWKVHQVS